VTKNLNLFSTKMEDAFDLGTWIGRKQAFSELAGRCSAADAECLRQVRDKKRYRALKMTWEEFCRQRLGISRGTAEKIIRLLEEFGPQYFVLSHATGITADEYRRISSAVHDQKLLHAGEEIPINAENAPRLAAAVQALKQQDPPAPSPAQADAQAGPAAALRPEDITRAVDKVERSLAAAFSEIVRLHNLPLDRKQRERLQGTITAQLHRLPMFQFTELRRVS